MEEGLTGDLAKGDFDLVIAKYVFEHLENPAKAMTQAHAALRKGGLLFYSVPNLNCPGARLRGPIWYANTDPTHVSLLKPSEWIDMTEKTGFKIVEIFSDGFWDLPYYKRIPRFLQLPLLLPIALACLTGWRYIPARWGENILVIAEKK
jgi:2-polyprenyl-3-methyl-5-hydroxy-6-metoxy-1,4-benzoquinol methylase